MVNDINKRLVESLKEWDKVVLEKVYANYTEGKYEESEQYDLSIPFALGITEKFLKSDIKMMIIGQEAGGFLPYNEKPCYSVIQKWCLDYYEAQIMGKDVPKTIKNSSPFWRLFKIYEAEGIGTCWNNLDKVHRIDKENDNKTTPLSDELELELSVTYGEDDKSLLFREIEIAKPDVIHFITGPYYNKSMAKALKINLDELNCFKPTKENYCNEITSLMPFDIQTFWSYHPRYLNSENQLDKCAEKIIGVINKRF